MQRNNGADEVENYITKMMLDAGLPAHLKGYRYLRTAILLSEKDMKAVGSVTKLLYPEIAKIYGTTDRKVERAIRNAIEISWPRGKAEVLEEIFGYSSEDRKERPTNSEYIAGIADRVHLMYRNRE